MFTTLGVVFQITQFWQCHWIQWPALCGSATHSPEIYCVSAELITSFLAKPGVISNFCMWQEDTTGNILHIKTIVVSTYQNPLVRMHTTPVLICKTIGAAKKADLSTLSASLQRNAPSKSYLPIGFSGTCESTKATGVK